MSTQSITITFERERLSSYTNEHLAALWHIAQANPAPYDDRDAGDIAEEIGREIISRWLKETPPPLWNHQGRHHAHSLLTKHGSWNDGVWAPHSPSTKPDAQP